MLHFQCFLYILHLYCILDDQQFPCVTNREDNCRKNPQNVATNMINLLTQTTIIISPSCKTFSTTKCKKFLSLNNSHILHYLDHISEITHRGVSVPFRKSRETPWIIIFIPLWGQNYPRSWKDLCEELKLPFYKRGGNYPLGSKQLLNLQCTLCLYLYSAEFLT